MLHSTITTKGQTTIPGPIRQALNIRPGDKITYELEGDQVTVRVHPGTRALAGALVSSKGRGMGFDKIRKAAAKSWIRDRAKEGPAR